MLYFSRWKTALILLVVLAGGGVAAAYAMGLFGSDAKSQPAPPLKKVEAPPPVDAAPKVTPAAAVEQAKAVLRANLKSASPRVQRVAASALARTGDSDAIGQLTAALGTETSDITKLEIASDAAPKDAAKKAAVALGYYYAGDADKAGAAAQLAVTLDGKQPIARYILAEIAVHVGDAKKARQLYAGLIADGHDSYDIRARLAQLAQEAQDTQELEKQLCAAKKLDPERSYPYQALSQLHEKQGDTSRADAELEQYAFLEQMELAPLKQLTTDYAKVGNWAKVRTYGEMGTYINPQDLDILGNLAHAYLELGDPGRALYTYDTMLVTNPAPRRPALVHLGRAKALAAMNKKADAKAALAQAKKTEPENAELLQLEQKLR